MKNRTEFTNELKSGSELIISPTNSLIQGVYLEGKCFFDSWDFKKKTLFVYFKNQPRGKRFLIKEECIIYLEK
jgi:hypothetical protein